MKMMHWTQCSPQSKLACLRRVDTGLMNAPLFLRKDLPRFAPGIALAAALAMLAVLGARSSLLQAWGLSALTLAIVLGMMLGNTVFASIASRTSAGVNFCKSTVLRIGIVLFGLRITFQEIAGVGAAGVAIGVAIVLLTFFLAVQLGTRVFGIDRTTSMLIGAGASICGAAAVMATQSVVRARPEAVSVAVATVVVFGTISMFAYPLLFPYLGFDEHTYGIFVGSTIHEVAQVVAAGQSIGDQAAATAVIEKMLRVMLLAPFLLALGYWSDGGTEGERGKASVVIPWFAVLFIGMAALNSLQWLPAPLVEALVAIDTFLLAMAMAALGVLTHFRSVKEAGPGPLKLGAAICAFLIVGGYLINILLESVLA
jgi:uncharacterized integral membrane protein (TIGR00698 family)